MGATVERERVKELGLGERSARVVPGIVPGRVDSSVRGDGHRDHPLVGSIPDLVIVYAGVGFPGESPVSAAGEVDIGNVVPVISP